MTVKEILKGKFLEAEFDDFLFGLFGFVGGVALIVLLVFFIMVMYQSLSLI